MPTPETSMQPKQFGPWAGSLPKQEGQSWLDLGKSPEANRNDLAEQERRERQTGALLSATQLARERYAQQTPGGPTPTSPDHWSAPNELLDTPAEDTDKAGHVPIN